VSDRVATLVHDVAKYVARIARNVPPAGPFPPALGPMLVRDLYDLDGKKRASERFDELVPEPEPRLARARALLSAIDALEARVRAGEAAACLAACEHAREVETLIRAYAKEER
jgi:hypothetical protein